MCENSFLEKTGSLSGKRNIVRFTDLSKRLQDREHRTDVVNTGVYYARDRHRVVNTPDHGCILSCPLRNGVWSIQSSSQKAEPSYSNDMHLDVRVRSKNLHRKWSSYNLWTATMDEGPPNCVPVTGSSMQQWCVAVLLRRLATRKKISGKMRINLFAWKNLATEMDQVGLNNRLGLNFR
jgi:hypothetical protein